MIAEKEERKEGKKVSQETARHLQKEEKRKEWQSVYDCGKLKKREKKFKVGNSAPSTFVVEKHETRIIYFMEQAAGLFQEGKFACGEKLKHGRKILRVLTRFYLSVIFFFLTTIKIGFTKSRRGLVFCLYPGS